MTPGELVARVAVVVGGAPERLCEQALRGAFADVCRQTRLWTRRCSLAVPEEHRAASQSVFELDPPPENALRDDIRDIRVNGDRLPGFSGNVHVGAILDAMGLAKAGDTLEWEETLVPNGGGLEILPDAVVLAGGDAAACAAAARLMEMPRRPWSNPSAAVAAWREFSRKLATLVHRDVAAGRHGLQMGIAGCIDE